MRLRKSACLIAVLVLVASAPYAWAVAIPLLDPGFDVFLPNTLTPVPDDRLLNIVPSGAGSGPVEDANLITISTFTPAPEAGGLCDVPAGWTATGQRPGGINNTNRSRLDAGYQSPSGTVAQLLSVEGEDTIPPKFSQTLTGVSALANSLYTATIQVSDLDIANRGPFMPPTDNLVLGQKELIVLSLSAGATNLGGVLSWSDVTPGGAFNPDGTSVSGGKSLLTLTVSTGASVPSGNLTISFTSNGQSEPFTGFAPAAQTFFDNATLDVTPLAPAEDADFDGDNDVDGNDFLIWQRGLGLGGQTTNANGDADGSGAVNGLDLAVWRAEFGTPQATSAAAAIPEPASGVLSVFTLIIASAVFGRARSQSRSMVAAKANAPLTPRLLFNGPFCIC